MILRINSDALKDISNMNIDIGIISLYGKDIFNNLGTKSPEYHAFCLAVEKACDDILKDAAELKLHLSHAK